MSQVSIEGNLTREPELRYMADGTAMCTFGLAENRKVQRGGREEVATDFHEIVVWRSLAERCAANLHRGHMVMVQGRYEQRRWETEDGSKRSKHQVTAFGVGASLRFVDVEITKLARDDEQVPVPAGGVQHAQADEAPATGPEPF